MVNYCLGDFGLDMERLERLRPEERVNLAVGMSDVCVRVCADGVRDGNPGVSEEELIERVRERLLFSKRRRSEAHVRVVVQSPKEIISVRYGRLAAFGEVDERKLVVIYERKNYVIEVVTALWVDDRRLRTLGFTGV